MRFVPGALRLLTGLLILATAPAAVLALGGFAVPELDLLNHLQMLLILGTLVAAGAAIVLRMRRRWTVLALIGLVASGWTFGPEFVSSLAPRPAAPGAATLKVMTHNLFGLNDDMARVDAAIRAEDPDIIALQEYFPEQAALDRLLRGRYPYAVRCQGGKRANLGLYSKLPFEREMDANACPERAFGAQRTAHIIAGFRLADGAAFSLITTHMDWPFPIERQREQFAATAEAARALEGPLLVVGDFNSTPWSYALRGFEAEAGLTRQTRSLITYPLLFTTPRGLVRTVPFLPLDQVFSRGLTVTELRTGAETGSDHLPVVFSFAVSP